MIERRGLSEAKRSLSVGKPWKDLRSQVGSTLCFRLGRVHLFVYPSPIPLALGTCHGNSDAELIQIIYNVLYITKQSALWSICCRTRIASVVHLLRTWSFINLLHLVISKQQSININVSHILVKQYITVETTQHQNLMFQSSLPPQVIRTLMLHFSPKSGSHKTPEVYNPKRSTVLCGVINILSQPDFIK